MSLLYNGIRRNGLAVETFSCRATLQRCDVIHIHWPEYLVRWNNPALACYDVVKILLTLWWARLRGAAIVWTAHNLLPHDLARPRLWQFYFNRFLAQTDSVISMGDGATDILLQKYPRLNGIPIAIIPHGHYRDAYKAKAEPAALRSTLGLDDRPVFLAFGEVRHYKNLPALVDEWHNLPAPRPHLVVAGPPSPAHLEGRLQSCARADPDIHLLLRFIDDAEVPSLFAVADVVVLPHSRRSSLNSGVALLALTFDKPVVMTDTAATQDLQKTAGCEWVYLCDGTARDALRVALRAAAHPRFGLLPDLDALDWGALAERTICTYRGAMSRRRPRDQ